MKGDFTRSTFKPEKRYSGVRQQQGRVQLDADWNEQVDIDAYLRETGVADLIGGCGVPRSGGGFKVGLSADGSDLTLAAGRLYVDGILCELGADAAYSAQLAGLDPALDAALKAAPPAVTGSYFAYADVWRRHVTAREDSTIRETALGGPDTATRTQTFWQVKLVAVDAGSHCLSAARSWQDVLAAPTGKLRARTHPGAPATEPCIVPANAGYTRLENQLYRVEVHQGGELGKGATFKWSRENGSVVSDWLALDAADPSKPRLTLHDAGRDKLLAFAPGAWVELTDDVHEIQGNPGLIAKVLDVQANVLTLDLTAGPGLGPADFPAKFPVHPKVRLWNAAEAAIAPAADNDGWLPLEDGVEVHFEAGTYHTGDYWLIPARAFLGEFSGDIEWPREPQDGSGIPVALPPGGVVHHFGKLAVVDFDTTKKLFANVRDCRASFPAVTELAQLLAVGGDGQEAGPNEMLPEPLEVRVANGRFPVPGVQVRFQVLEGKGGLSASRDTPPAGVSLVVTTDAAGLAAGFWSFGDDAADPRQRVEAVPLDAAGTPVPGQVVHFNASHAHRPDPGIAVRRVTTLNDKKPLDNDSLVNLGRFLDGLVVTTDRKLADTFSFPPSISGAALLPFPPKPNFQIILHLPFTQAIPASDTTVIIGFQPILLAGTVAVADTGAQWTPTPLCRSWLGGLPVSFLRSAGSRLLVQVILKGRFIWSADGAGTFLDGEAFGQPAAAAQTTALSLPSGDGRRGGDFEMWFWLVQNPVVVGPAGPIGPVGPVGPVIINPVLVNPAIVAPVVSPASDLPDAPAEPAGAQRLTDLRGIGRARAAQLAGQGIHTPADLAAADPARVAEILGIPEETARGLVAGAGGGG